MKKNKSPERLEDQKEITGSKVKEFITQMYGDIQKAEDSRDTWKSKLTRWYKKRYGIRPTKSFPWPNCSNLHIPLTDKTIRKMKPSYVQLAKGGDVMCYFNPTGPEDMDNSVKAQQFFDFLLRVRMKILKPLILVVDKFLEKGFAVVKCIYEYRTRTYTEIWDVGETFPPNVIPQIEDRLIIDFLMQKYDFTEDDFPQISHLIEKVRAGETKIEITLTEEEYNAPRWIVKNPTDVIVPPDTDDIQEAQWVCDISYHTTNDLLKDGLSGKYDLEVVKKIIELQVNKEKVQGDNATDTSKQERMGVYEDILKDNGLITIYEVCCYYDINNDSVKEKCVLTVCPFYLDEPLRFIEFPYQHGKFPYIKFMFELNDEKHYSPRGVPEILDHLQTEMTIQHNQKIDNQTLANAPVFKYIPGVVNPSNVRFIPGQGIPVHRMDALEQVAINAHEMSYEREEQVLKAWAEEYIGVTDFGTSSPLAPTQEARTKYEVQSINANKVQIFTLAGSLFQESLKELYEQTWALWLQYGPEQLYIRVMNEESSPFLVTREEIQGMYDLQPSGKVGSSNPILEAQKSLSNLQIFKDDPYINQKELRADYLRKLDPRLANRLLLTDEMIQMGLSLRQQAGQEQKPGEGQKQIQKITQQPAGSALELSAGGN